MKYLENKLGVGFFELIILSLLGLPRIILHDLSLIEEGTFINGLLVCMPIIIWITYILVKNVETPFLSMFILCCMYGVFLALTHQILWLQSFPEPVQFGGNLSNVPPAVSNGIARVFAFLSSLTTGAVLGVILGAVTRGLNHLLKIFRR